MSGTHSLDQYVSSAITLTSDGAYLTPFTVTTSGTIDSASIGLYGIALAPYLLNEGAITGQTAAVSLALGGTIDNTGTIYGGTAADGIILGAGTLNLYGTGTVTGGTGLGGSIGGSGIYTGGGGTLVNSSSISGGAGGYSSSESGDGGAGASLAASTSLQNFGVISGGEAGAGAGKTGNGGYGVLASVGASVSNAGLILGGAGAPNGVTSGGGGAGVYLMAGASLANLLGGVVRGGNAGASKYAGFGGDGVAIGTAYTTYGGVKTLVSSASLVNLGAIKGGNGGYGGTAGFGGDGGRGVVLDYLATFTNAGSIAGGYGGAGGDGGGKGGSGVEILPGGTLNNQGEINGGSAGAGPRAKGGYGAFNLGGEVINSGVIRGAAGGTGGDGGAGLISLFYGTVDNTGSIIGANAVYLGGANPNYFGGAGVGVDADGDLALFGNGTITGGNGYGGVSLSGRGGIGLFVDPGSTITNGGPGLAGNTIIGGTGGVSYGATYAGDGGIGILLLEAQLVNYGSVAGGAGGYSQTYSGNGGVGVYLEGPAKLVNFGVISGGEAGDALLYPGYGGDGAYIGSGASLANAGLILGGPGMSNGVTSSAGGYGVYLAPGAYLGNLLGGTVRGGTGGASTTASEGGTGVWVGTSFMFYNGEPTLVSAASLVNLGNIYGGQGGYAGPLGAGGYGGAGVALYLFSSFTNAGTIVGGGGGTGGVFGGYGGTGVKVAPGGVLTNQGLIIGGAGGAGPGGNAGDGAEAEDGEIINTGSILGGTAGADGGSNPGYGGAGINLLQGSLNNSGNIAGGQGGAYTSGGSAGTGGYGLYVENVYVTNTGTIAGADAVYLGEAGAGLRAALGFVSVTGDGTISGGNGHAGPLASGPGGYGMIIASGSSVYNAGNLIQGGAGADGIAGNAGPGGTGAQLAPSSYLYNAGIILGGAGGANISGAGDGTRGGAGAYLRAGAHLYNAGSIAGGNGGASVNDHQGSGGDGVDISGGQLWNAGTIAGGEGFGGQAYAVFFQPGIGGDLTVSPNAVFDGLVIAHDGDGDVLALAAGSGTLSGFGSEFTGFDTLAFTSGAEWDAVGNTLAFGDATIGGFGVLDTLDIGDLGFVAAESLSLSGDTLSVVEGMATLNLTFEDADAPYGFTITSDGAGGTDVNAICYVRGTRILTPAGEVPIEDLAIGDVLVTRFGGFQRIRWIGRQNFDWRFVRHNPAKIPVRIAPGALADGVPARELAVSPGHSLLLGDTLVLARDLVNGVTVWQEAARETGLLEYFQIELDSHDCIVAEGCWAESYADAPGQRAEFHNAAEYAALYPEAPPPDALQLCAARPEQGRRLAAALLPVVARAWAGVAPGRLEGWLERAADWRVEGWALDTAHPALPVLLEVWLGERLLGTALAHAARRDLAAAGKGQCAFSFASPVRIRPEERGLLSVRRAGDGAELPGVRMAVA